MASKKFMALMILIMGLALLPATAVATPPPDPVSGTFEVQSFGGPGCPSPFDLCASGIATGGLAGDVFVVITNAFVTVDGNGIPFSNYTASISIATRRGTINGTITGAINLLTGDLASTVNLTNGDRYFNHRTGSLTVTGFFDFATGAELDFYNGFIQMNPPGRSGR